MIYAAATHVRVDTPASCVNRPVRSAAAHGGYTWRYIKMPAVEYESDSGRDSPTCLMGQVGIR
jgi:hypothetical protein